MEGGKAENGRAFRWNAYRWLWDSPVATKNSDSQTYKHKRDQINKISWGKNYPSKILKMPKITIILFLVWEGRLRKGAFWLGACAGPGSPQARASYLEIAPLKKGSYKTQSCYTCFLRTACGSRQATNSFYLLSSLPVYIFNYDFLTKHIKRVNLIYIF